MSEQSITPWFVVDRWANQDMIKNWLRWGHPVILDRYILSGVAYARARGIDDQTSTIGDVGLVWPDLTFLLDVDVEITSKREGFGKERDEEESFQKNVLANFRRLATDARFPNIIVIDPTDINAARQQIMYKILERWDGYQNPSIRLFQ